MSLQHTSPMLQSQSCNYAVVAAIDFGTTYSGYAFSYTGTPDDIKTNSHWGAVVGAIRNKTPTCVLTDNDNKFVAFGYEALNKYSEETGSQVRYRLYDRFKMQLYKEKVLDTNTEIRSRSNSVLPARVIIEMSLTYLSDEIVKALAPANVSTIDKKLILWVLTVPAIWSESAKQFMRRAAMRAGLVDSLYSNHLVIALEPEAASFWCRQLTLDKYKIGSHGMGTLNTPRGTTYMVLDCGGGTIDTAVHKIVEENRIEEVHRATGGPWGGNTVDDQFVILLTELLGSDFISMYQRDFPYDWLMLIVQFETKKRSYDPKDGKSINLSINHMLGTAIEENKNKTIEQVVEEAQVEGVSCKQGHLVFSKDVIERIFMSSISKIIKHVQTLLQEPKIRDISYIFLVGGYSDCALLQHTFEVTFSGRPKVMVPVEAGVSVMKGAVMFGYRPKSIVSRIARKTYGEAIQKPFDHRKHDPSKMVSVGGTLYCKNIFRPWVKKNESVPIDESFIYLGYPSSANASQCQTYIYSSSKEADKIAYVTDDGVDEIGTLTISIPDTNLEMRKRIIRTILNFGSTEIHVRVEDSAIGTNGDFAETTINFTDD